MKKRILGLKLVLVLSVLCFGCTNSTTTALKVDISMKDATEENPSTNDENITTSEEVIESSKEEEETPTEQETETPTKKPSETPLTPKYTVANGCEYYDASNGLYLGTGETIPVPERNDVYITREYEYSFNYSSEGWNVTAIDKTKTSYGEILSSIAGISVLYMYNTFESCENLITSPKIPLSIKVMNGTFSGCKRLTTAPEIPISVTDMMYTFCDCESLTAAPEIPSSVNEMYRTFFHCKSLTGTITINANPYYYEECFFDVYFDRQNITLVGSSTMLEELKATAN